ncbi:MAG: fused MFS/spermidine synthase [Candidatus Ozemobacteraceae bacterium]
MVWAAALTFFQTALFAGYAGVHLLFGREVTRFRMGFWFFGATIAAFFSAWNPKALAVGADGQTFLFAEWSLLARNVGLPVLALACGAVTLQRWWRVTPETPTLDPAFLFSASNAGSFAALLCFPFLFEPLIDLPTMATAWHAGFLLWIAAMGSCVPWTPAKELVWDEPIPHPDEKKYECDHPVVSDVHSFRDWVLPAAAGTALLSATTNLLTLDLAALPLLWIPPLAIYLWTYVRAFSSNPPDAEVCFHFLPESFAAAFALALLSSLGFAVGAGFRILLHLVILYKILLGVHLRLAEARPQAPNRLTRYYLCMAGGGWLGSAIVTFGAPFFHIGLIEYPLALAFCAFSVWREPSLFTLRCDPFFPLRAGGVFLISCLFPLIGNQGMPVTSPLLATATAGAIVYAFIALRQADRNGAHRTATVAALAISLILIDAFGTSGALRERLRTYYGWYKVFDRGDVRYLQMGSTYHGHEVLSGEYAHRPAFYYHPKTPIGKLFATLSPHVRDIAVIGLGAGVLAACATEGRNIDFFELDPAAEILARRHFSYLASSSASVTVVIGDGRLALGQHPPRASYDLIILDAFSSDAVPVHLLTVEALAEYRMRLNPHGFLLFHISNRHLDLAPNLTAAARCLGLCTRISSNPEEENAPFLLPTRWLALGSAEVIGQHLPGEAGWNAPPPTEASPWTDRFSSIIPAMVAGWKLQLTENQGWHSP